MKYHKDAYGLPSFKPFKLNLRYSRHAQERAKEKGIDLFQTTLYSDNPGVEIFEIEDTDVRKYALREPYNATFDLCMAVDETGFVRTVWLNRVTDKHCTLNKKLYDRP